MYCENYVFNNSEKTSHLIVSINILPTYYFPIKTLLENMKDYSKLSILILNV